MSSEAAQKAYPEKRYGVFAAYMQEGFDRGAVEALRQAAEALHAVNMPEAGWLVEGMADDREMRQ